MVTFIITILGFPATIFAYLREQKKQQEAIFLIRISIFERAFLMYQRTTSQSKKDPWEGWVLGITEWLSRANFSTVWKEHGTYFDKSFFEYFNHYTPSVIGTNQAQSQVSRIS